MGSPGDSLYPFPVPCCGLVVLLALVGVARLAWGRRVEVGRPDDRPPSGGPLDYAGPHAGRRRRTVLPPAFWRAVALAAGLFVAANAAWFAYLVWDHRTRTTTLLLVDPKTGQPARVDRGEVYVDCPDAWSTSSVTYPAPGMVRVQWTHACSVEFSRIDWIHHADRMATLAMVDDDSPATITVRFAP